MDCDGRAFRKEVLELGEYCAAGGGLGDVAGGKGARAAGRPHVNARIELLLWMYFAKIIIENQSCIVRSMTC